MSEKKQRTKETAAYLQNKSSHGGTTTSSGSTMDSSTPIARKLSIGKTSVPATESMAISSTATLVRSPSDQKKDTSEEVNSDVTSNTAEFLMATTMLSSADVHEIGDKKKGSLLSFGDRMSVNTHISATEVESLDSSTRLMVESGATRLPPTSQRISIADDVREPSPAKPPRSLSIVRIHQPSAVMMPPRSPTSAVQMETIKSTTSASRVWTAIHLPEARETGGSITEPPDGTYEDRRGLRFYPSVLVFRNVFEGERRVLHFTLQNVSTRPIKISIISPSSVFFSLEHPNFSAVLAPGLCHRDTLTLQQYSCHADSILPTCLSVVVDGKTEVYEIETHFAAPQLAVDPPELDFGTVNLGAPVRVQTLTLRNFGSLVCNFAVDVSAQALELNVKPTRGKVHAYKTVSLRCELAPALEGHFTRMVWVRGAGVALHVPVHVHVVRPRLELCYPPAPEPVIIPKSREGSVRSMRSARVSQTSEDSTTERDRVSFAFIDFGPVYYGTTRRLTAAVRSASADICTFVVLAELSGGEMKTMQDARAENPEIAVFRAHPYEGRIESFETRIFTFAFEPQLWVRAESSRSATEKHDFLIFLRVMRVLCIDLDRQVGFSTLRTTLGRHKSGIMQGDDRDDSFTVGEAAELRRQEMLAVRNNVVRLCLHGEAVPVALTITPTALTLGRVALGVRECRVLRFTNLSPHLPLKICVTRQPPPGVHVTPAHGKLTPGGAVELTVRVAPVCFGEFHQRLKFELLGRSEPLLAPAEFVRLGFRYVNISYVCPAELPMPPPRVAMGLSPIINREVGVIGDGVTFCSSVPKPRMAMLRFDLHNQRFCATQQSMITVPRKRFIRALPSDVCQKAPPSTPERNECQDECNPARLTCCQSCYRHRRDDWSHSSGWSSDDDEDDEDAARRRNELAEATAAAAARAEVERLLVPDVPRIACGVVMEPIPENGAEAGETPVGEMAEDQNADAADSEDVFAAAEDRRSAGCVIGNLLDAMVQACGSSSGSSALESSTSDGSGNNRESTEDANASHGPHSAASANASLASEDAVLPQLSSEKLLNVTEFITATPTHAHYVHTDHPRQKTKNIVGKTSAAVKKANSSSALLADLGTSRGSGDHGDVRSSRPQGNCQKQQQQNSTSSSSNSKNQLSPPASSSESVHSVQPVVTSSGDIQKSHHSEATKTTKSFNAMSKQPRGSSTMSGKMASKNVDELNNLATSQAPAMSGRKLKAENEVSGDISLESLNPSSSLTFKSSTTTPISDNSSGDADQAKEVYSKFSPTKHCREIKAARLLRNKIPPKKLWAKKHVNQLNPVKYPLKDKLTVLVNNMSTTQGIRRKPTPVPKTPATSMGTTYSEDLPTASTTNVGHGFSTIPVQQSLQTNVPKNQSESSNIRQPSHSSVKKKRRKFHKKKMSKEVVEKESDEDDDGLVDAPSTPDSWGIALPVAKGQPSFPYARDRRAEALDIIEKDRRCEALQWARGEPVDPHCAFIAFPNDMAQRSVRPWPPNRLTRSIFTGVPRYVPPINEEETLKPEEMLTLREREEMARIDIRDFAERYRAWKASGSKDRKPIPDYDVADSTLYNYLRFRPGCLEVEQKQEEEERAHLLMPMKVRTYLQALVPLTPTQLINVRLAPPQVDYGTVGVGSHVNASVIVHNTNTIPVKVNATSSITALSVAGDGVVYVEPHDSSELVIIFQPSTRGRFNGMLRYVVNDSHVFEAPVIANVVLRSLILPVQSLRFGFLRGSEEAFPQLVHVVTIKNPLQVACKFEWLAVDRTCYEVIPRKGEVPSLGSRACEVTYCANLEAQTPDAALLLASESDNYLQLSCRLVAPSTIPAGFVRQVLTLPDISLLRKKLFRIYLYNASYMDVLFRVEDHIPGADSPSIASQIADQEAHEDNEGGAKTQDGRVSCIVRPAQGSMRPRSLRRLYLMIRALAPGPVSVQVRVNLGLDAHAPPTSHGSIGNGPRRSAAPPGSPQQVITTTINTVVSYPNVVVRPSELRLRRVPAGAQIAESITLQNMGTVEATVRLADVDDFGPKGEWSLSLSSDHVNPVPLPLLLHPRSPPLQLYLLFRPTDVGSYEFYVPFVLNGGAGPPVLGNPKTTKLDYFVPGGVDKIYVNAAPKLPCLHVDATVARRIVGVSRTEFNFNCSTGDPSTNETRKILEVNRMDRRASTSEGDFTDLMMMDPQTGAIRRSSILSNTGLMSWCQSTQKDELKFKDVLYLWTPLRLLKNTPFTVTSLRGGSYLESAQRILSCEMTMYQLQSKVENKMEIGTAEPESQTNNKDSKIFVDRFSSLLSAVSDQALPSEVEEEDEDEMLLCSSLEPGESSCWEIKFQPKERGIFSLTLPVFLTGFSWSNSPLVRLELTGVNDGPSLKVDAAEIFLPPRPLNTPSEATIWLEARNFEIETEVIWTCENVQNEVGSLVPKDCLQVVLMKPLVQRGPEVTRLMGTVIFKAVRPMGVRARIALSAKGRPDVRCSFKVVASADSSLFTTHTFLRAHHFPFEAALSARGASPGGQRRTRAPRGRTAQFSSQQDLFAVTDNRVADDDWPLELKSLQSGVSNVSFVASAASSVGTVAEAVAIATVQAAMDAAVPVQRSSQDSVQMMGQDSKLQVEMPHKSDDMPAIGGPRRRRGDSRCSPSILNVDPDQDSLGSSENSEDEDVMPEINDRRESSTRVHEMFKDVDEGYGCRLYPDVRDNSDYADYFRRVNQAVEEWAYDVCFRHEYWPVLPFGMNVCYKADHGPGGEVEVQANSPPERSRKKKGSHTCPFGSHTPFVALKNIAGTDAVDMVLGRKSSESKESVVPSVEGGGGVHVAFKLKESEVSEAPGPEIAADALSCVQRYATFLYMIRCNGAVLPHVRPEYLLDYARYETLFQPESDLKQNEDAKGAKTETRAEAAAEGDFNMNWSLTQLRHKLPANLHRRICHMAWIDVGLQMARTFWLPKIDEEHTHTLDDLRLPRATEGLDLHSRQYNVASVANHSVEELFLLAWLNEHYERARRFLCPHSSAPPSPRLAENFDRDLADGLILAGVTVSICPYLKEYLPDLFAEVTNQEEAQHNAARLISAWSAIRVGFTVSVRDLVRPLGVKMLLLVAYLYNVLPSMSASSELNISAPLSTRGHTSLTLVNPSSQRLFYLAEFIGDPGGFFSALAPGCSRVLSSNKGAATMFPVNPGQKVNINVYFHARTFKTQDCTLVLTGNLYAPNFGRAVAFHLEGEPSSLDVSATLYVTSQIYRPTQRNLTLPLPYALNSQLTLPLEFDLYLQETEPEVCKAFLGRTWAQQRTRKVLRRLSLNQNRLIAEQEAAPPPKTPTRKLYEAKESASKATTETPSVVAQLSATICAFTPFPRHFWIGCVHPTFGDFIVKLVSRPTMCSPMETLTVPLPADWQTAKCTCGGRMSLFEGMNTNMLCPLISTVMVPSRNTALWNAVVSMFEMTLDEVERRFWKRYLDSQIGVRLVQWILEKNEEGVADEYDYIFNTSATYKTYINNSYVSGPTEFFIPDLLSNDCVPLMVHLDNLTPYSLNTRMKLTSTDKREIRIYGLVADLPAGITTLTPQSRQHSDLTSTIVGSMKSTVGTTSITSEKSRKPSRKSKRVSNEAPF